MEQKRVLIIEGDKALSQKMQSGLRYFLLEAGVEAEVLVVSTYEEGLFLAEKREMKTFVVGSHLPNGHSGVALVKSLREMGYVYEGVVFVSDQTEDAYKVRVHEQTKYTRFLAKPVDINALADEVILNLKAPSVPKLTHLPLVQGPTSFKLSRQTTLLIQKVKYKDRIEVWQTGPDAQHPVCKEYAIESFEKLLKILLSEKEKQFRQCERTAVINTDAIEELNKAKHYVRLVGYPNPVAVGPAYREVFYTLF